MKVDTVNTLVDTGVHLQPPVFQGEIRLVDTVDTYSRKNYWGSKTAARPVASRARALQWEKGIHRIHPSDKANYYSVLGVDTLSGGYPPLPWDGRSRRSRASRVGPSPSGRVGGSAEPRCFPLQKKFQMGNPVFPNLPAFPPFPTFPRGPHDPQD